MAGRETVEGDPGDLAADGGRVWVILTKGVIVRMDPRTGRVVAQRDLGIDDPRMTAGSGSLWVTSVGPLLKVRPF